MSAELMDLLIGESRNNKMGSQEHADFMWVLRVTGARPGELGNAEAFHFQKGKDGQGRLVFRWNATVGYVHKTAKKTQRDRTIYLTPELTAHVEKLIAEKPKGPIFRTPRDAAWSLTSLSNKWTWLMKRPAVIAYCKQHDIPIREVRLYNFRHSFISHFLDQQLAEVAIAAEFTLQCEGVNKFHRHRPIQLGHALLNAEKRLHRSRSVSRSGSFAPTILPSIFMPSRKSPRAASS